jgi:MFS family permease
LIVSLGMGGVFTGLTTAANAGVGQEQAGLAAGLLNTGQQLGTALGLAILSALATARTSSLLHAGDGVAQATTSGYQLALLIGSAFVLGAGAVSLPARNTRQTRVPDEAHEPALDLAP